MCLDNFLAEPLMLIEVSCSHEDELMGKSGG